MGFLEGAGPVVTIDEVVQGPEEQHGIDTAGVDLAQIAGITEVTADS